MTTLRVVLPDQLDRSLIPTIAERCEHVVMAESGYLFASGTHARKLALLAAAGRHYAAALREAGVPVQHFTIAGSPHARDGSHTTPLGEHIVRAARAVGAERLVVMRPGSWSEIDALTRAADTLGTGLTVEEDRHFYATPAEFAEHAAGRKRLVMEYFYRELRKKHAVLIDPDDRSAGAPAGGEWNYDSHNRDSFGADGPTEIPAPPRFEPDDVTREAIDDVKRVFSEAPGSLEGFALAVTPTQAEDALTDFVRNRLPRFGRYQDAMWAGEPYLFHSFLSPMLNLRLLDPRDAVERAEQAWLDGEAPVNSVEGFVRQILGWREFVRGVYYHAGRDYGERNALGADRELPRFYWDGETDMRCAADVMSGVFRIGYAHHIQRLMVMGLFAMLYGADPAELHRWHLSLYADAYDWVSAPNVIGMSQYADGGVLATKPYAASGKYIDRMSNYCTGCRYEPDVATGERACPFTTLYWDFLRRHREALRENRRMRLQVANLDRKKREEVDAIHHRARSLRKELQT